MAVAAGVVAAVIIVVVIVVGVEVVGVEVGLGLSVMFANSSSC